MNIFYAPPEQITKSSLELTGQEASHASKTLRYKEGDKITVVDGQGGWYEGIVNRTNVDSVWVDITTRKQKKLTAPRVAVAAGIIKKKSRLEFAVEKVVELGAAEIALFRSNHSVKQNVRTARLETVALSAMKQSLRAWLPEVKFYNSLDELLKSHTQDTILAAHQNGEKLSDANIHSPDNNVLLITGPEGDFSDDEMKILQSNKGQFITLGKNRYRTETAAIIFLNSFLLQST